MSDGNGPIRCAAQATWICAAAPITELAVAADDRVEPEGRRGVHGADACSRPPALADVDVQGIGRAAPE